MLVSNDVCHPAIGSNPDSSAYIPSCLRTRKPQHTVQQPQVVLFTGQHTVQQPQVVLFTGQHVHHGVCSSREILCRILHGSLVLSIRGFDQFLQPCNLLERLYWRI
jgi:hypothetical protein